jgi:hypothetical protein
LASVAYALLLGRITRIETQADKDRDATWHAIDEIRNRLAEVVTKDDLRHTENRIVSAMRPGHAD